MTEHDLDLVVLLIVMVIVAAVAWEAGRRR